MSNDPNDLNDFYSYMGGSDGGDNTSQPVGNVMPDSPVPGSTAQGPGPQVTLPSINDLYNPIHDAIAGITNPQPHNSSTTNSFAVNSGSSVSGFSDDAFARIDKAVKPGYAADLQNAHNEAVDMYSGIARDAATASAAGKSAALVTGEAEAAKADENAKQQAHIAEMEKQNAIDEQAGYAKGQLKVQGYMADYEKSLNELSTMSVNPGRAYSNLSGNAQAGVKLTAFITDFLGAKGIKSSGMDYINRGVDMDIQAQKDNINLQKDVVAGKQNLWQMQRAASESDYEADVRTKGMLLNAAKTQAQGILAGFDSPIARAKAAEVAAAFDEKLVDTRAKLTQLVDAREQWKVSQATELRKAELSAAATRYASNSGVRELQKRADLAKEAADGPQTLDDSVAVTDGDGNLLGRAHDATEARVIRDRVAQFSTFQQQLKEYSDLVAEVKSHYKGPGQKSFTTNDKAKLAVALKSLGYSYAIANNGSRPTDKDYDNAVAQFSEGGWTDSLLNDSNATATTLAKLGQLNRFNHDNVNSYVNTHIIPVTDPNILKNYKGGASAGSLQTYGDINVLMENYRNQPKPADDAVTQARGNIEITKGVEANKMIPIGKVGDLSGESTLVDAAMSLNLDNSGSAESRGSDTIRAPKWLKSFDDLYQAAKPGPGNHDADLAAKARATLQEYVKPPSDPRAAVGRPPEEQHKYDAAIYYLNKLDSDGKYYNRTKPGDSPELPGTQQSDPNDPYGIGGMPLTYVNGR